MARGRKRNRKAGEATNNFFQPLLDFDDWYSKGIRDTAPKGGGDGPIDAMRSYVAGSLGVRRDYEQPKGKETFAYPVVKGAQIASRYLLLAGGVTLAGKGLYDLTVGFGGTADQPEQQQLTLDGGQVVGTAALGALAGAGPSIYNEVRDKKFRTKTDAMGAIGMAAAGAGGGVLTSVIGQSLF